MQFILTHAGAGAERNSEALSRQHDELQIKPADLVSLTVSFFWGNLTVS
jgi:hypothetical protein